MSAPPTSEPSATTESNLGKNLRFVLASGSQRRRDIMHLAGLTFIVQNGAGSDAESDPEDEPDARRLTRHNAELKLRSAVDASRNRMPWDIVIVAADTVVTRNGHALGKPADRPEAISMLLDLRGKQHEVVTSVAMTYAPLRQRGEVLAHSVVSKVSMREYADSEIDQYIETGIPFDRAGAYGVQDVHFNPAKEVIGCYLNVVGLPLCAVRAMLPPKACTFADSHIYATCAAHERGAGS